jgi:hypothetical protein
MLSQQTPSTQNPDEQSLLTMQPTPKGDVRIREGAIRERGPLIETGIGRVIFVRRRAAQGYGGKSETESDCPGVDHGHLHGIDSDAGWESCVDEQLYASNAREC